MGMIHLLPLSVFVLLPGTFIISYVMSVMLKHVEVDFPYISDTGTHVPESCVFGQLLNLVACLIGATVYVRYKQVIQYFRDHLSPDSTKVLRMNRCALVLGWVAAFGVSMVANFQETSVIVVHGIGATLAFAPGTLYSWVQTVMSFYMQPLVNSLRLARFRLFLSLVMTVFFVSTVAAASIATREFDGDDMTKWRPENGGFVAHVVSTASEWTMAFALDCFILTFVKEFHWFTLSSPQVHFIIEEIEAPSTNDFYRGDNSIDTSDTQPILTGSGRSLPTIATIFTGTGSTVTTQAVIH